MSNAVQATPAATRSGVTPSLRRTAGAALVAALASAAANASVRLVAVGAFDIPQPEFQPLTPGVVSATSAVGALGAGVVFAALSRFARRPRRTFGIVAIGFLAVSLFSPLSLLARSPEPFPGTGAAAVATLIVMHVVVASISVAAIAGPSVERGRLGGASSGEEA